MYPNDQQYNHYYQNNSNGYQSPYGQYNTPYTQPPQPESPQPEASPRKSFISGKAVALVLACAIAGGAAGVGGAAAYLRGNTNTTVIYQSVAPSTQADTMVNTGGGNVMTPDQLYAANVASCVGITTTTTTNFWGYTSSAAATGSGFVLTEDGYIVTNYHVIEDAVNSSNVPITVSFRDGSSYTATLIGGEQDNDVAVLKIEASGLTPVTLGDSDQLVVGQTVMAIGNPLGELDYSLTDGIVSALDRLITTGSSTESATMNMLQTNCAINPGNSGGPLFNSYGQVIGITTAKYTTSSSGTGVEGLGFAIPINDVKDIVDDLIKFGYVTGKPYMGINMQSVPQNAQMYGVSAGAYILYVAPGSCAEKAGIQQGDIIVGIDDTVIDSSDALKAAVSAYRAGDSATLKVIRNNQTIELPITFDEENEQTVAANQYQQEQIQTQQPQQQIPSGGFGNSWPFGSFFY